MKILPVNRAARQRGVSLIECIVYIAVLVMVLGTALVGFNRCWDNNKHLRRNAEDIVRALHAGEQWRADLRAATGKIQVKQQPEGEQVIIPLRGGPITYTYSAGTVQRQTGLTGKAVVLLNNVKTSAMAAEPRLHVTAWRWELELAAVRKDVAVRPIFTFETVAGHTLGQ